MMRRPRLLLLLAPGALVLGALVLGACGDGDEDSSSTTTTSTTAGTAPAEDTTTTPEATTPAEEEPEVEDPGEDDGLGDSLVFAADLTGDTEVPGPGDAGGSGRIEIESSVAGEWCVDMEATGLSAEVTDAHIHFGPAGNSGDVVIPIGTPTSSAGDTDTWTDVCVAVDDDLAAEVVDAPQAFYANIHTGEFGGGAIRGQLEPSSLFDLTLS